MISVGTHGNIITYDIVYYNIDTVSDLYIKIDDSWKKA